MTANPIGQSERATQNRVINLFRNELAYRYLDDWTYRGSNSNIDESLLSAHLTRSGCTAQQVSVVPSTNSVPKPISTATPSTPTIRTSTSRCAPACQ
jgi:hypothetical protein